MKARIVIFDCEERKDLTPHALLLAKSGDYEVYLTREGPTAVDIIGAEVRIPIGKRGSVPHLLITGFIDNTNTSYKYTGRQVAIAAKNIDPLIRVLFLTDCKEKQVQALCKTLDGWVLSGRTSPQELLNWIAQNL